MSLGLERGFSWVLLSREGSVEGHEEEKAERDKGGRHGKVTGQTTMD